VSDDPYESANRSSFASHQILYSNVIRPVVSSTTMRSGAGAHGIHNFLVNIDLPVTFGNDLLQGKIVGGGETLARFTINSTAGIGGFVDVAQKIGIPEHETGFADTMATMVSVKAISLCARDRPSVARACRKACRYGIRSADIRYYVPAYSSAWAAPVQRLSTNVPVVRHNRRDRKISRDPYATTRLFTRNISLLKQMTPQQT